MAARKGTISKFTLAFATACLLTITSAPVLSQNIEQLFQQGYDAGISGRFEEAESIFRQVIRIDPNNSTAYHNLGLALIQQSQLYLAIANYQKAIQLNPNLAEAYNGLGNAFIQLWHLNLASANYQKAIQLNPNLAEAYNGLGNALMQQWKLALQEAQLDRQQWQLDLAITNYQKAIQLNPNLTEALSNLSIAQRQKEKIRQSKQEKDNFNLILRQYNRSSITQKEFNEEIGSMKELQEIPIIVDLMSLLDNSSCVLSCFNDIYHDANIYNELGNALLKQVKLELAITSYKL
ncbi:MAG: tetratricopeptide repeat protein [Xenococcus sp. (in: cyanobacteria)]